MHNKEAGSLIGLVRHHPRAVLIVLGVHDGRLALFLHLHHLHAEIPGEHCAYGCRLVTYVMTVVLIVYMLLQPPFGALSDRIGRKNNMILFTALWRARARAAADRAGSVSGTYAAFALVLRGLLIASFYTSISGVVKAELFPTEVRALGVGLTYAVANAMFGGTAEYVALWLKSAGHEPWFAWYVAGMVAIGLVASILMPDTRKYGYLEGSGQIER